MARFAHMADIHLVGWKFPELQDLNFRSFQKAVEMCISEKLDFILIAGDLFDNAFPSIEILKKAFGEFRKIKDAGIPCFIIAGSHDYSASGKTFLDVLENAGFCRNVENSEMAGEELVLKPTYCKNTAIYGYRGKKTGLEINEIKKMSLHDGGNDAFKILMLHTTLDRVVGDLPIEYVDSSELPKANYYALGHIHVLYDKDGFVYPCPMFPNNFKELEDLKHGHFVIADTSTGKAERVKLKIKEVEKVNFNVNDAVTATEDAIFKLNGIDLNDKIVLLRFSGQLQDSKVSNINFRLVEDFAMKKGAYFVLKNTHELREKEEAIEISASKESVGDEITRLFLDKSSSKFKEFTEAMIHSLSS